jgi:hypothetical protein
MDHNREFRRPRKLKLSEKNLLLYVTRRMVVKIIEPYLPPGNDLGSVCEQAEFLEIRICRQLRFMGMNADGGVDEFVFLGEPNSAIKRSRPRTAADRDDIFDASVPCPRDHPLTVSIELLHFEMCVGIYENQSRALSHRLALPTSERQYCPGRDGRSRLSGQCFVVELTVAIYFSLVPTGTSSKKLHSTGFPPSGEAATIIPFDSSPRSLRGARFATMTTLRPIKDSGA